MDINPDLKPLRLTLSPGRVIRLRVVDSTQTPIPRAWVVFDTRGNSRSNPAEPNAKPIQADFTRYADAEGEVTWTNAPEGSLLFNVIASGFFQRDDVVVAADAKEATIELGRALTVFGMVRDAKTGEPIPQFRMTAGWPRSDFPRVPMHLLKKLSVAFGQLNLMPMFEADASIFLCKRADPQRAKSNLPCPKCAPQLFLGAVADFR